MTQKTKFWKMPMFMSLQVNNPAQNNDISTFMNEKHFAKAVIGF